MTLGWALVQIGMTLFPFVLAEVVILVIVWPLLSDAVGSENPLGARRFDSAGGHPRKGLIDDGSKLLRHARRRRVESQAGAGPCHLNAQESVCREAEGRTTGAAEQSRRDGQREGRLYPIQQVPGRAVMKKTAKADEQEVADGDQ